MVGPGQFHWHLMISSWMWMRSLSDGATPLLGFRRRASGGPEAYRDRAESQGQFEDLTSILILQPFSFAMQRP